MRLRMRLRMRMRVKVRGRGRMKSIVPANESDCERVRERMRISESNVYLVISGMLIMLHHF